MVNTLNSVQLNITEDTPSANPIVRRNKIAGSGKHKIHKIGIPNKAWNLKGWLIGETKFKELENLISESSLNFVDKFGDSYTVTITSFEPVRKTHNKYNYTLVLEEL